MVRVNKLDSSAIFGIDEQAGLIECVLDDLHKDVDCDENEQKNLDLAKLIKKIDAAIADIWDHYNRIMKYCRKFRVKFCYFATSCLFACANDLKEIRSALEHKKMTPLLLNDLSFKIACVAGMWSEKYIEDFESWQFGLVDGGLHLSNKVSIYENPSRAYAIMIQNALKAETLFYAFARNKQKALLNPIKDTLKGNRFTKEKTKAIDTTNLSGRSLITVTITSVQECLTHVNTRLLVDRDSIVGRVGWQNKSGKNWNREKILRGWASVNKPFHICYQFQPVPGQLANIFTSGIGSYGTEKGKSILSIINAITDRNPENEKKLAKLFIRYKRGESSVLNENTLREQGFSFPAGNAKKTLIERLNRVAYLICFQEIYRRKNQGHSKEGMMIPELPFGVAVSCLLKLLSDGHISMEAAFDDDADYGVFTGKGVMSENLAKTIQKFNNLFALFVKKYAEDIYEVFDYSTVDLSEMHIVFNPEFFHSILQENEGGEYDSDNEEYTISDSIQHSGQIEEIIDTLPIPTG